MENGTAHGASTVRTELHRHPAVATLSTYIQWKMEDDHTYHNRQVHDNTIHHMVLTTYFSMHVRNLSKVLYLLCLWCLLTIVSSNSHTGLVWRFYSCVATAGCRCSSVRTVKCFFNSWDVLSLFFSICCWTLSISITISQWFCAPQHQHQHQGRGEQKVWRRGDIIPMSLYYSSSKCSGLKV